MWKGATGICRYETTNCEDSITLESELVLRPSTTFSSHVLTGRRQRSAFSDRSPGRCLPRYWSQSRSPRLPSVRRDEYWDRLKRCRVADAVIKANTGASPSVRVSTADFRLSTMTLCGM